MQAKITCDKLMSHMQWELVINQVCFRDVLVCLCVWDPCSPWLKCDSLSVSLLIIIALVSLCEYICPESLRELTTRSPSPQARGSYTGRFRVISVSVQAGRAERCTPSSGWHDTALDSCDSSARKRRRARDNLLLVMSNIWIYLMIQNAVK